jgi:predicted cupin superfamily sugar epimerase
MVDERMRPSVDEIKSILGLEPHPTCGFTTLSYLSPHRIANAGLPAGYRGTHTLASALYFLVTPERPMQLHRLRSDQIYHHYLGDPLESSCSCRTGAAPWPWSAAISPPACARSC